jgi:hypothetical protein
MTVYAFFTSEVIVDVFDVIVIDDHHCLICL